MVTAARAHNVVPLSVLDLSPVASGSSGAVPLRNSLDLARLADRLGFTRYWVAEHHNLPSIASAAPDIMIGQIAAVTERMRIGSGGVMLPNHAPLMVAERFKVLEALFPGRIDLGLGRAPGTDPITSYALRRRQDVRRRRFPGAVPGADAVRQRRLPGRPSVPQDRAMPEDVPLPPIWLLGSSDYSAQLAAMVGSGFSFAHHFADHDRASAPMRAYREQFKPSAARATPMRSSALRRSAPTATPRPSGSPPPSTSISCAGGAATICRSRAPRRRWPTPIRRTNADSSRATARACSSAARRRCATRLTPLIEATGADEVMITTMIYDHAARRHSYELLAEAFGLRAEQGATQK